MEEALIRHLETFLLELGQDFAFIGRQRRLRIGDEWYRIDLLFFHRRLRCLMVIDLKLGKFSHADVGQMHLYLAYAPGGRHGRQVQTANQGLGPHEDEKDPRIVFQDNGIGMCIWSAVIYHRFLRRSTITCAKAGRSAAAGRKKPLRDKDQGGNELPHSKLKAVMNYRPDPAASTQSNVNSPSR